MNEKKGNLYLVPTPIGDNPPSEVLPASTLEVISRVSVFVAEEIRTARRFLSSAGLKGKIGGLRFYELSEHSTEADAASYLDILLGGEDVAVVSEAGLPAVADPGATLVAMAQKAGVTVIPMVGPSSLMLSLMASGLNGQRFSFNGYLPVKTEERRAALSRLEKRSAAEGSTELFIETPYRNDALLADVLAVCKGDTSLCIASDITMADSSIVTRTVAAWRAAGVAVGKKPCVFLLLAAAPAERRGR